MQYVVAWHRIFSYIPQLVICTELLIVLLQTTRREQVVTPIKIHTPWRNVLIIVLKKSLLNNTKLYTITKSKILYSSYETNCSATPLLLCRALYATHNIANCRKRIINSSAPRIAAPRIAFRIVEDKTVHRCRMQHHRRGFAARRYYGKDPLAYRRKPFVVEVFQ